MEEKTTFKKAVRYLFQTNGVANLPLGGVGAAQQSPFLERLFDPNNVSLAQFFNTLFKTAIVVGAMLAVLRLGYAGFVYMTTDIMSQKQTARSIISNAVLGLMLLLAVWLILRQINPDILNLDILRSVPTN
jgi:hypothetical protein